MQTDDDETLNKVNKFNIKTDMLAHPFHLVQYRSNKIFCKKKKKERSENSIIIFVIKVCMFEMCIFICSAQTILIESIDRSETEYKKR